MIVKSVRYAVTYKIPPLRFNTNNSGEFSDEFDDAALYQNEKEAIVEINNMDNPEEFTVIPITLSFEI